MALHDAGSDYQASTSSIIVWLGRMMNGTVDMEALNAKAAALE
ncbi:MULTISPECIES: hypothetical protein [Brucella]|uniref:Uncharacterized protein n=2 Tax=Brucella TaxID=234 RepID=A0A0H3AV59_BRUO2|nr:MULTISPECIES: hypothetical protein [Brucella]ABQ62652.1 hypothetical protein BOV_A0507 [Brucella ovis ATCC 25840]EEH13929.1 Hypothetical protein, conserved [Brucella ceti str. Cudo]ENR00620.1 hypothetical protein C010_02769 [Brucella ovis 80/125]ENR06523.1 hypothetical protein C961_02476 [Brucella ovis F8/05B]ENR17699.1 hypothetical protein C066_00428 [Brucella sp. UK5/01]